MDREKRREWARVAAEEKEPTQRGVEIQARNQALQEHAVAGRALVGVRGWSVGVWMREKREMVLECDRGESAEWGGERIETDSHTHIHTHTYTYTHSHTHTHTLAALSRACSGSNGGGSATWCAHKRRLKRKGT